MSELVVLGTGMAAAGAARVLRRAGRDPLLFDKNSYPGGHTATFEHPAGFLFDDGPHISFTRDSEVQELFARNVGGAYEVIQTRVNNHWKGHWIKHPAQCNLHGLPSELVGSILRDLVDATGRPRGQAANYGEWLRDTYGDTFSETFPMEYGLKYHTTEADNMTTEWLGPRLYRPRLDEVLHGALEPQTPDVHYVSHFRYPSRGGFFAYLRPLLEPCRVHLEHEVVGIDPASKRVLFARGGTTDYSALVSSIPLPEVVRLLAGAPREVRAAGRRLACTTCVLVNIGVDRADLSEAHWTYFYDRDFFFTRLSFPHMLSPHVVPQGCGSIQAECYYSEKYRPLDRAVEECVKPVLDDLRRCGLLRPEDRVLAAEARLVPYANVIFDLDRPAALATVRGYLEEIGIHSCGRYGEWGYHWTDESYRSGEAAAERALAAL